jgi:hypothetical protein
MLVNAAGPNFEWRENEIVQMSPEEAQKWADGIRGELVIEERVQTPERGQQRPELRRPRRG